MPAPDIASLRAAHEAVLERIEAACARAGRRPDEVQLVAVTKTVPAERVRDAVAVGLDLLGENRVQEAAAKIPLVPGGRWHLVGPLQSNKARRAVELFEAIESIDSPAIAQRVDGLAREIRPGHRLEHRLEVYLQVNIDADPAKTGFDPAALEASLPELLGLTGLRIAGLMTIGRLVANAEEARPTFRALRELSARLRGDHPGLGGGLSMGMTDDYPVAVEEGATVVRIGRALFGERH